MSIAIITDSTAYLDPDTIQQASNLFVLPVPVLWQGHTYADMVDLQPDTFFAQLAQTAEAPTTSMPSMGEIDRLLSQLTDQGFDDAIIIPMSAGISSFASALHEFDDRDTPHVHLFDTKSTAGGNNLLVHLALSLADHDFDVTTILTALTELRDSMTIEFVVQDLRHLQKTGRINGAERLLASLFHVCPVLEMDTHETGEIRPMAKERTEKRALAHIQTDIDTTLTDSAAQKYPYRAVVFDGNYAEAKADWLSHLEATFPAMTFDSSFIGPAIGCHTGSGVLGVAWAYDWQAMTAQLLEQRTLTSAK